MKQGDYVRFKYPEDTREAKLLFEILEERGTRILVREVVPTGITPDYVQPTFVYRKSDMELISHE